MSSKGILVQAHRGCPSKFPENSIKSFEEATKFDVAAIELDIACTSDGVIVVSHDPFVNPDLALMPDGSRLTLENHFGFSQLSFDQLSEFRFGEIPHLSFTQQETHSHSLPSLEEVFEWHAEKDTWLNIEIKYDSRHENDLVSLEFFMEKLIDLIKRVNPKRIVLQSFSFEALKMIARKSLDIPLFYLAYDESWKNKIDSLNFVVGLGLLYKIIDEETIQIAKDRDWLVSAWTVNEEKDWESLLELGVKSIITDYPDKLLGWMSDREIFSLKGLI